MFMYCIRKVTSDTYSFPLTLIASMILAIEKNEKNQPNDMISREAKVFRVCPTEGRDAEMAG